MVGKRRVQSCPLRVRIVALPSSTYSRDPVAVPLDLMDPLRTRRRRIDERRQARAHPSRQRRVEQARLAQVDRLGDDGAVGDTLCGRVVDPPETRARVYAEAWP